ncbi:hypothetical protein V6380_16685 [Acinetobacter variabilis]|uniref:hypothetical protein n=1 Tax=Acinetobacter variabilis TaxID=70346 RepID=UPI003B843B5E
MVKNTLMGQDKFENKGKGQAIFYGVFVFLTLSLALYTSTLEIPANSTFSHDALVFAKVLFFIILMFMNAFFVVKFIQNRAMVKMKV